jgi:hypothetical protein
MKLIPDSFRISVQITAVIVLIVIGLLNMISPRSGTQAQVVLTGIKVRYSVSH